MQDAPSGWPTSNAELTPTATCVHTVNGSEASVEPVSWSVRRELATDLPDQIQQAEGLSVASASIELAQEEAETVRNAWSPWEGRAVIRQPAGASIELDAGFSGVHIPMFRGRVAEPRGDVRQPAIELECDDLASLLRRPATLPAVAREMPHDIGDSVSTLYTGLTATWAVDAILRQGGFCATPATVEGAVIVATMQGSVWPELGRLTRANQGDTTQPRFAAVTWAGKRALGWQAPAAATFNIKVEQPAGVVGLAGMHVSGWADGTSGTGVIDLRSGDNNDSRVTLTITATQIVVRVRADSGAVDTSATYSFVGGAWDVDLDRLTDTTVRVSFTDSATTDTDDLTTGVFGGQLDNLEMSLASGDLVLAGLQVGPQQSGTVAVAHVPTADLDPSLNSIDGTPGLEGDITQWAALREIAAAELAAIFLVEDGTARFRNRDSLRGLNNHPGGLKLAGVSGDYASTPDAAALDITGDIDLRAEATLTDWTAGVVRTLVAKYHSGVSQRSYILRVSSGDRLQLVWSANGTSDLNAVSTVAPVPGAGGRLAVRATLDVDNGASGKTVTFYTATSIAGPWTQLGSAVTTAGTTSVFSGSAALTVGARNAGSSEPLSGTVHKAEVRSGIAGTVVASPDFTAQSRGTTAFTDAAGLLWTVHGDAEITTTLPLRVTARDSIIGLQWWSSVEQARSEVRVPVMPVAVETSTDYSRTVWELNEKIKLFEAGRRPVTIWAKLDAVPIELDTTMRSADSGITGSQYAAHPNADGSGSLRTLIVSVDHYAPRRVKIVARSQYTHVNVNWIVNSSGQPRMILRALASIEQGDNAEASAVAVNEGVEETYGTSVLEMPASRWMQDMDSAQALAWWLAEQTRTPQPIIRQVPVVPGPDTLRLQLGDTIELVDPVVMDATVRCVVTGLYPSGSAGRLELTLAVRPIPYLFKDFNEEWAGMTFAEINAELAGQTFADFNANPWRFDA